MLEKINLCNIEKTFYNIMHLSKTRINEKKKLLEKIKAV